LSAQFSQADSLLCVAGVAMLAHAMSTPLLQRHSMKKLTHPLSVLALAAAATSAGAADFHFTGDISHHNDVIQVPFHLDNAATDVKVWTDSFQGGSNFDPVTAVWSITAGGTLVAENDDRSDIGPGQTYYDSGITLAALGAGDYTLTVAAYPNFRNGNTLAEGFAFDGSTPIALADWCQPSSAADCSNQKGGYFSVWLTGVDSATISTVPEPQTYALMLFGLAATGCLARRKKAT
jgi:PEP-CTERM motif